MKKKLSALCIVLIFVCLSFCGCSDSNSKANGKVKKDEVIVAMPVSSEPEAGFNPVYGWGAGEHVHEPLIQSTLFYTTSDLGIELDLAESCIISEDGLTWTITVRDDVKFTDGDRLTAEDVAFTYNKCRDESSVNDFSMLKEAIAVDKSTVEFHLKYPFSSWYYTMAVTGIVPKHAYNESYGENPIGSGKYIMKQWDAGQQVIFEANPDYYGKEPNVKKLTVIFMEEDTALAAAQAGEVDVVYTAASYADLKVDGYSLFKAETVDNRGFNLPAVKRHTDNKGTVIGNNFTADVEVRRAINIGIDRDRVIDDVLNGYGCAAYSVCDKMPWYNGEAEVAYNPDKAKEILDNAGWKTDSSGVRSKDGVIAEFKLLYPSSDSVRQALAESVKNQLEKIGIKVTTEGVGWDTAYTRALSDPLIWGWGAHTPMELYNIYHTDNSTGYAVYSPYSNDITDKYMDDAMSETDLNKSYELWKKAQWDGTTGITQQGDIPWIWLCNIEHLYFVRDNLKIAEQKIHPHGHGWSIVNNVDMWSWE